MAYSTLRREKTNLFYSLTDVDTFWRKMNILTASRPLNQDKTLQYCNGVFTALISKHCHQSGHLLLKGLKRLERVVSLGLDSPCTLSQSYTFSKNVQHGIKTQK